VSTTEVAITVGFTVRDGAASDGAVSAETEGSRRVEPGDDAGPPAPAPAAGAPGAAEKEPNADEAAGDGGNGLKVG
jgi:hypothetical protein